VREPQASEPIQADVLRDRHVTVPDHVVSRSFAEETVVLNLETGQYHGLDTIGGRLFELLQRSRSIGAAASQLATEYGRPLDEVEPDVLEFCRELELRGLVVLSRNGDQS
jgi:hypothetical protein